MDSTTETRTFVGKSSDSSSDSFASFCIGQTYQLRVTRRRDGNVALTLNEVHDKLDFEYLVLTAAQFDKWFMK